MEKKSIAALIVTGAMVLGVSGCGTNGATSDNADNSTPDTSTPVVTEPVDGSTSSNGGASTTTSSQTEEEVEETLGIELPPVEVWYVRDYDMDKNGTISKDEWEKWCEEHPDDKNQNMHIDDDELPQTQTPTVDTSGNPDPGSEQTSKPSTSKPSTSTPSSGGDTLTEEEKANGEAFDQTVEDMGGWYDPSTGITWVP